MNTEVKTIQVAPAEEKQLELGSQIHLAGIVGSPEYNKEFMKELDKVYTEIGFLPRLMEKPSLRDLEVQNGAHTFVQTIKSEVSFADGNTLGQEKLSRQIFVDILSGLFASDQQFFVDLASLPNTGKREGPLNATEVVGARQHLSFLNRACSNIFAPSSVWSDCIGDESMRNFLDPVPRYNILMTGFMGHLFGAGVYSDAFHRPALKLKGMTAMWFLERPEDVGTFDFEIQDMREVIYTSRGTISYEVDVLVHYDLNKGTIASSLQVLGKAM